MIAFASAAKTLRNSNLRSTTPYLFRFQNIRTLLLQSASKSVKLQNLSDSDSGILEVNLERPGPRNAIGKDMLRGLQYTFEAVSRDHTAKVLMICSSVPKVFCAGADLKERKTMSPSEVHDYVNSLRSTFSYLEALCIPTIAVIEGAALGGGLEMALSCDLRICGQLIYFTKKLMSIDLYFKLDIYKLNDTGEDAVLGLPETGLAIIPGYDLHTFCCAPTILLFLVLSPYTYEISYKFQFSLCGVIYMPFVHIVHE
ncbi:hypothetical protein ACS0TY_013344 [Phlomoides rotata]